MISLLLSLMPPLAGGVAITAALALLRSAHSVEQGRSPYVLACAGFLMFHGLMGVAFVIERLGGFDRHDLMPMVVTVDGISTLLLAWLVVRSNRIAIRVTDGMTRSYAEAAEYARARQDYEQLLRHRIANPLTVISGGADALLRFEDLDRDTRRQLLSGIASAAESLREASAQTEHSSTEEQGLNGVPDIAAIRARRDCEPRPRRTAAWRRTAVRAS